MTTYPAVKSIQVIISSADGHAGGTVLDYTVNLQGRLPPRETEFYVKLLEADIQTNGNTTATISDLVSVHVSLGQPLAITSSRALTGNLVGCYNHTTHSTSASTVRASNPDLTQVSVRFRNAKDGGVPVAKKADGSAEQITSTVLYLELVPITYDLIAHEQVGYKHPTF